MRFSSGVFLILMVGLLYGPLRMSPPYPSPWFTEHIQLGSLDLPDGVSVELRPVVSELSDEVIVVRNTSSTILYVIGWDDHASATYADIQVNLAPGIGPLNKIADGQASKWHAEYDPSIVAYRFGWAPEDNHNGGDSVWLQSAFDNLIATDEGIVVRLKPVNNSDTNRPVHVAIPGPQEATLPLIYGTQELSIPLTVSYELNKEYPYGRGWILDYSSAQIFRGLLIISLYLLGGGVLWLAIRSLRRSS